MPFPAFDRSRLIIKPLGERIHDLDRSVIMPLDAPAWDFITMPFPISRRMSFKPDNVAALSF